MCDVPDVPAVADFIGKRLLEEREDLWFHRSMPSLAIGTKLPDAVMSVMTENGFVIVQLASKLAGRKTVVFALPGAFTGTCSTKHLPSFMRTLEAFKAKGVEEIFCVVVNDPFVLQAWGAATGSTAAGITLLADADGSFTNEIGMAFSAPAIGLYNRSNRYALVVNDGVVTHANLDAPGVCDLSTGEALLALL